MYSLAHERAICTTFLVHLPYWPRKGKSPFLLPFPNFFSKQNVIHIQQLTSLYTSILKSEATCTSEMSATLPTTIQCENPGTELTSIVKNESLKS
jgi:hypothetical protein